MIKISGNPLQCQVTTTCTLKHGSESVTISAECLAFSWWKTIPFRLPNCGHVSSIVAIKLFSWEQKLPEFNVWLYKKEAHNSPYPSNTTRYILFGYEPACRLVTDGSNAFYESSQCCSSDVPWKTSFPQELARGSARNSHKQANVFLINFCLILFS